MPHPLHNLDSRRRRQLETAGMYLFSPQQVRTPGFLESLERADLKKAYRKKMLRYHPDRHTHEPAATALRRKERFLCIQRSFDLLSTFIERVQVSTAAGPPVRPRVIAVGGSKGGIGKSTFAANLGVVLSAMGKRTVLVDLDLGGSNLHLYLGALQLKHSIHDFIDGRMDTLQEVTTATAFGTALIGGDSSKLGIAQLAYPQKMKIIQALREIPADVVVADLGGDTSFNTLDFFNSADASVVMTTCNPAAYMQASLFVKAALFRRLTRIFSAGSPFVERRDENLENAILEEINAGGRKKRIWRLVKRVSTEQPENLDLLREIIESYHPCLVMNDVTDRRYAEQIREHIMKACKKILFLNLHYAGAVRHHTGIAKSAITSTPVTALHPKGVTARELRTIAPGLGIG